MERVLNHVYLDVVSNSDRNHRTATTAYRTLGLTPAGTMCHSNLSLGFYPIPDPSKMYINIAGSTPFLAATYTSVGTPYLSHDICGILNIVQQF